MLGKNFIKSFRSVFMLNFLPHCYMTKEKGDLFRCILRRIYKSEMANAPLMYLKYALKLWKDTVSKKLDNYFWKK